MIRTRPTLQEPDVKEYLVKGDRFTKWKEVSQHDRSLDKKTHNRCFLVLNLIMIWCLLKRLNYYVTLVIFGEYLSVFNENRSLLYTFMVHLWFYIHHKPSFVAWESNRSIVSQLNLLTGLQENHTGHHEDGSQGILPVLDQSEQGQI